MRSVIAIGALALARCGGGGGGGAADLPPPSVVSVRFVGPGGSDITAVNRAFVPRNAWVEVVFSTPLDPATAVDPNVRVRRGPSFEDPSMGAFHVDGSRLLFDPTVTPAGFPRPFGFDASADYEIRIPAAVSSGLMLRGAGGKAILSTFVETFHTTDGWIVESVPPTLVSSRFEPPDVEGKVSPTAALVLQFSEIIDPRSATTSIAPLGAGPWDAIDARYDAGDAMNVAAGLAGVPILVRVAQPTPTSLRVTPVFSWGDQPFRFDVRVLPPIKDLAGNQLSPSARIGPLTCLGGGVAPPRRVLGEPFEASTDRDAVETDATWGPFAATGTPLSTRRVRIQGGNLALIQKAQGYPVGQFMVYASPLVGAALNNFGAVTPATSLGRRVLLSFNTDDLGSKGTIVSAAWGPDRNATFLATYSQVILRMGYGTDGSLVAGSSFSSSYTTVPVEVYRGSYSVAQKANVGNEVPATVNTTGVAALQPLFDYSGFVEWPPFQTPFDWDPGLTSRTLLFDMSATEGNTWQDQRAYFAFPPLGVPIGMPMPPARHLVGTFDADAANPAPVGPVLNPDPSVVDTAFTIATRRAVAQSLFYTPDPVDPAGNAYAGPYSSARTRGTRSDYGDAVVLSTSLPAGATYAIEYQGAMGLDATSSRSKPDLSKPLTPWTTHVDACDGYPFLRWRLTLLTGLLTGGVPVVDSVVIPVRDSGP